MRPSSSGMSIESVTPSSHLMLCHSLLLPSIRVFSSELAFLIRGLERVALG